MKKTELVFAAAADPRWLQVSFLLCYVVFALTAPGFGRAWTQFAAGFAACLLLDAALLVFHKRVLLFPLSGMISSLGLLLLCDSPLVWPYVAVGAASILSKHFVRANGRHVFNPLNFGIVVGLLFLSSDVAVVADRWGGRMSVMCAIACLGVLTVWRAKRLDLALAYALTFVAGAFARSHVSGTSLALALLPATGAAFQLFTFFMITDPMTTPETRRGRIVFGVAVAALEAVLRYRQIANGPLFALFALSPFVPVWRAYAGSPPEERIWKLRNIQVSGG